MCAFMTPVLKNDWDVFNTKKSRHSSANSQTSSISRAQSGGVASKRVLGSHGRSKSYHAPPSEAALPSSQKRALHMSALNSRVTSRGSFTGMTANTSKDISDGGGHKRSASSNSLSKFHAKVLNKLRIRHDSSSKEPSEEEQEQAAGQEK